MSLKAMMHVWEHSQARANDRLVLLAIADEANDEGKNAWPSIRRLAAKANCSKTTVVDSIKRLEASNELVVRRPERQGRGRFSQYEVVLRKVQNPDLSSDEPGSSLVPVGSSLVPVGSVFGTSCDPLWYQSTGTDPVPKGTDPRVPKGTDPCTDPRVFDETEKTDEAPSALERAIETTEDVISSADESFQLTLAEVAEMTTEDWFEQAWEVFPGKRGGKVKASEAFRARVRQGISPELLVSCARHYAQSIDKRRSEPDWDEKYVLHAKTFFGPSERWREFIKPPELHAGSSARTAVEKARAQTERLKAQLAEQTTQGKNS
jgi:hypothetical protein